eukprot:GFYU01025798.1.p1 GENE.GFYU01025798.1~~GFYU01025798.1.p1  ORF type:complete len:405 (-),score=97.88 GFYU01025798.1:245-1459(-)
MSRQHYLARREAARNDIAKPGPIFSAKSADDYIKAERRRLMQKPIDTKDPKQLVHFANKAFIPPEIVEEVPVRSHYIPPMEVGEDPVPSVYRRDISQETQKKPMIKVVEEGSDDETKETPLQQYRKYRRNLPIELSKIQEADHSSEDPSSARDSAERMTRPLKAGVRYSPRWFAENSSGPDSPNLFPHDAKLNEDAGNVEVLVLEDSARGHEETMYENEELQQLTQYEEDGSGYGVRLFSPEDTSSYARYRMLRWRAFRQPYGRPFGSELYDGEEDAMAFVGIYDLANADEVFGADIVGGCFIMARGEDHAQLHQLVVDPSLRGHGKDLGRKIVLSAARYCGQQSITKLYANAGSDVSTFYSKCGFIHVSDRENAPTTLDLGGAPIPHILMEMTVAPARSSFYD